ncbi:hypothetical protein Jab_2c34680 [Janthinobacterium sp. HH01]|uniref:hypothetical protein n=1 Tax=Janthinobacterium sp. HH01 TaxID=1198452 RepID=UPI0002AEB76E|nr:hypothetical protein [Janthinobacterium sp. HH01]ELX11349.1 hypothetical protein Jab_2c34680 [Janthinobacterium sp. HH01]
MDELARLDPYTKAALDQCRERMQAMQMMVAWLMHEVDKSNPGQLNALKYLSRQANELEESNKFPEYVALLDELREDYLVLSGEPKSDDALEKSQASKKK